MRNLAVINLNTIKQNAKKVKAELPKKTLFCGVVKADAYGHGGVEVASCLYGICDCFAVAIVEEGIELRLGGIDKEILVLVPAEKKELKRALFYRLTLTVDGMKALKEINAAASEQKTVARVHVAYNTGMNRIGVDGIEELTALLEYSKKCKNVKITGFFSHLGCPQNQEVLNCALNKFLLANKIIKGYNNKVISHISASGGYLKGVYLDMVRIGILLYGYKPFESDKVIVNPAMKVYSRTVKRRILTPLDRCMYGDLRMENKIAVSIVRVGYADGLPRNAVFGQINDRCMDLTALKGIKRKRVCVMNDAEKTAKQYGTISYEILTKASLRAEKKYIR